MAHPSRRAYPQDVDAASLPLGLAGHDSCVQALVLCPTRELAEQVAQELRRPARTEENFMALT